MLSARNQTSSHFRTTAAEGLAILIRRLWHGGRSPQRPPADLESKIFSSAADLVTASLNSAANVEHPAEQAQQTLNELEQTSAKVNASWDADFRFRSEIQEFPPILTVTMGIAGHETFYVLAQSGRKKSAATWESHTTFETFLSHDTPPHWSISLSPLHRGTSQRPRFLVEASSMGCAGFSYIVRYTAYESNPSRAGSVELLLKQEGAFGIDSVAGFPRAGKSHTSGSMITLSYCWFSNIDTWANPSLCAADTYDLSGDLVKFHSRTLNRPDLLPVSKVIEFAEVHDYRAVLAYCASSQIAQKLITDIPPDLSADDLRMVKLAPGKESIELGFGPVYRFEVEKQNGRWQVSAFSVH